MPDLGHATRSSLTYDGNGQVSTVTDASTKRRPVVRVHEQPADLGAVPDPLGELDHAAHDELRATRAARSRR